MGSKHARHWTTFITRELTWLGLFVAIMLTARWSIANHYHVPSGSMQPTIEIDDRVWVNKLAYGIRLPFMDSYLVEFEGPHRGDVVVLDSPEEDIVLIKRVVAIPGDRVGVSGGHVILNGEIAELFDETSTLFEMSDGVPHHVRLTRGGGPDLEIVTVPEDHYLVLGDNRGESRDGRYFGFVSRDHILGCASGVYYRHGLTWEAL